MKELDQFHDRARRMAHNFMLVISPGENFDSSKEKFARKRKRIIIIYSQLDNQRRLRMVLLALIQ